MYTANFQNITTTSGNFNDITVTNIDYIQAAFDPSWSFHLHSHSNTLEISYVFEGKSAFFYNDRLYETKPGDIIIKSSNVIHAEKSDIDNPIEQICINIKGVQIKNYPPNCLQLSTRQPIINVGDNKPMFDSMFRYILNHIDEANPENLNKIQAIMRSILEIIYNDLLITNNEDNNNENQGKDVKPVLRFIEENFATDISIEKLSQKFFISPFYLSKKFKAETGYTINQYIIGCRMGEAQRLLIFSNAQIKDIAVSVGYENLPYFYSSFKKYVGCTPRDYKMKYLH